MRFSAHAGDGHHTPKQTARRCGAERDDRRRLDDGALLFEPPPASLDLIGIRTLVQAPLAAHLELEVFHGIGDEGVIARNARRRERLIENPTCRSDERLAGAVFLVTRLLAHQYQMRPRATLA